MGVDNRLICYFRGKKKGSAQGSVPLGEPLVYNGDASESNSGRFFGVVRGCGFYYRGWVWRIKKGQPRSFRLPLKMDTKKAQYPYIGHCAVKKIRLHLSSGAFS
jgi:hypothetical protein